MASNRLRSLRNVGTRLNSDRSSLDLLRRRPAPTKLATNLINTGNLRRYIATEPIIAPDAITNEKIDDGAVDTGEIADDAVTVDQLDIDAVTGKNVSSCYISDSDIENCRFSSLEGSDLTVTDTFDLTSGTIAEVDITGPSTITGSDVVLTSVDLVGVTADTITASGGSLNLVAGGNVTLDGGGGAIINGGGGTASVTGSFFSVTSGGGFNVTGSSAEIGVNWQSFFANGEYFIAYSKALTELNRALDAAADAQAAADAIGPCTCPPCP